MNKRNSQGHYAGKHSWTFLSGWWAAALLSVGLLYAVCNAVLSNFASFRSCNANDAGIKVVSCGKGSLNIGDVALVGVLALSAALTVALFTAAWRYSRKGKL